MSFVCEKHERYVPDGEECPYCETPEAVDIPWGSIHVPILFAQAVPSSKVSQIIIAAIDHRIAQIEKARERDRKTLEQYGIDADLFWNAGLFWNPPEHLHARLDDSPCLCDSPTCPNPAKLPGDT